MTNDFVPGEDLVLISDWAAALEQKVVMLMPTLQKSPPRYRNAGGLSDFHHRKKMKAAIYLGRH